MQPVLHSMGDARSEQMLGVCETEEVKVSIVDVVRRASHYKSRASNPSATLKLESDIGPKECFESVTDVGVCWPVAGRRETPRLKRLNIYLPRHEFFPGYRLSKPHPNYAR
jgi:hypothetical protein